LDTLLGGDGSEIGGERIRIVRNVGCVDPRRPAADHAEVAKVLLGGGNELLCAFGSQRERQSVGGRRFGRRRGRSDGYFGGRRRIGCAACDRECCKRDGRGKSHWFPLFPTMSC